MISDISRLAGEVDPTVCSFQLDSDEVRELAALLTEGEERYGNVQENSFLTEAPLLAHRLPAGLRSFMQSFGSGKGAVAAVIRGLSPSDSLCPTPAHWSEAEGLDSARREDIYLCLAASLLGKLFAWSTLQRGKLVTDVLPIAGEENAQSGHGTTLLAWHTEDAFHPRRCEHLLLLCLRNPSAVPTTVARLGAADLGEPHIRILREQRFYIRPDTEHIREESSIPDAGDLSAYTVNGEPVSVIGGPPTDPTLRIDPIFMEAQPGDAAAANVLNAAIEALEHNLVDIVLSPGELLVIDNRRAVHGRGSFTAHHDGTDRWLKKVMVSRELGSTSLVVSVPHANVVG